MALLLFNNYFRSGANRVKSSLGCNRDRKKAYLGKRKTSQAALGAA
jgi:hypothetical protein